MAGDHSVKTLGITLSAGTTFDPNTIEYKATPEQNWAPTGIISSALAKALFKDEPALGKTFYDDQNNPIRVIGVISHMQGSWVGWDKVDRVMLTPRIQSQPSTQYAIRTVPGELDRVMADVEVALRKRDPNRVIGEAESMSEEKARSYAGDSLMAVTLTTVTGLVLVFSALGIFGLATFNVNTRTRQIGTRRALGATRGAILRYFLAENFVITTIGLVFGISLTYLFNIWLMITYDTPRLPWYYLAGGLASLWLLGQLAVMGPAARAARVPPAVAARS